MIVFFIFADLVGAPVLSAGNFVSLDMSNNGRTVVIEKQQMIEIVLQSNLAVSHQWMLDIARLNPDVLSEVGVSDGDESQSRCNRWLFRAKDSGVSSIRLSSKNLSDNTVFETFEVSVTVFAGPNEPPSPFSLVVQHNKMNDVIVGQKCVFLMTVIDEGKGYGKGEPVNISATNLLYATTVSVEPRMLVPGQVAEITVVPGEFIQPQEHDPNEIFRNGDQIGNGDPNEIDSREPIGYMECVVAITAERNGVKRETLLYLNVYPEEDLLEPVASDYRDMFIPYLASKYPELGIAENTAWEGTVVRPRYLVVTYYLFFSEQWEMGVRWHVMIPPYDWAEMYLRKRGEEFGCTHAFKISSVAAHQEPQVVDVFPEGIWR
jgi:hypothetical protein